MPLFSEHISNMYYSGTPSYISSPYSYGSSYTPLTTSYSASYLNPGASYSNHSSLGYSRSLTSRWIPSTRSYSPMLSTISERGTSTPVRVNSPRRAPIQSRSNRTYVSNYSPRPVNINTADIDVSRNKYQYKKSPTADVSLPPQPEKSNVERDKSPVNSRVENKPEAGIDTSLGVKRGTIKRDRTVVRLHTLKRKERDSPRKPVGESQSRSEHDKTENDVNQYKDKDEAVEPKRWREKLSDDLVYKDTREKKTLGEKLVEKFQIKHKDSDVTRDKQSVLKRQQNLVKIPSAEQNTTISNKSPDRRCSMEMLAEQASLLDSLIRRENLSTATLDLSKIGTNEDGTKNQNDSEKQLTNNFIASEKSIPLTTTKSDHSLHNRLIKLKDQKHTAKRKSVKKSASGGNISKLNSITEIPKELSLKNLPVIDESRQSLKDEQEPKTKPPIKTRITSTVEITPPSSPLRFKVENITVDEKPRPPKKEIVFSSEVENAKAQDEDIIVEKTNKIISPTTVPDSPEPEDGNFWNKIGKRETVYLMTRKQKLAKAKEEQQKSILWYPEEESEYSESSCQNEKNGQDNLKNNQAEDQNFRTKINEKQIYNTQEKIEQKQQKLERTKPSSNSEVIKADSDVVSSPEVPPDDLVSKMSPKDNKFEQKIGDEQLPENTKSVNNTTSLKESIESKENTTAKSISGISTKSLSEDNDQINTNTEKIHQSLPCDLPDKKFKLISTENSKPCDNVQVQTKSQNGKPKKINKLSQKREDERSAEMTCNKKMKTADIDILHSKNDSQKIEDQKLEHEMSNKKIKATDIDVLNDKKVSPKTEDEKTDVMTSKNKMKATDINVSNNKKVPQKREDETHNEITSNKKINGTDSDVLKNKTVPAKTDDERLDEMTIDKKMEAADSRVLGEKKVLQKTEDQKSEKATSKKKIKKTDSEVLNQNKVIIKHINDEPSLNTINDIVQRDSDKNVPEEKLQKETSFNVHVHEADAKPPQIEESNNTLGNKKDNELHTEKDVEVSNNNLNIINQDKIDVPRIPSEKQNIPSCVNEDGKEQVADTREIIVISNATRENDNLNLKRASIKPVVKPIKPLKEEKSLKPLIATPRPLQKKVPQMIRSTSSSETSSDETTSDDEDDEEETSESESSGEFFECENPDGRTSTGSNDSGFDSCASTSPAGFSCVRKDCDVNCHRKCEKLTANLCGVNQRLLVEALATRTASKRGADCPSTSAGIGPAQTVGSSILEQELEQSTAYGLFRKTGRFTPPARSIPRFRKYTIEDFQFIKVLGKGSFGKVLLAELRDTEYYYAVKCLKKDVVLEDDDVECTLIERKVLALGTNHPYLCHLFATFQTDSHLFFVMEYLNGGDLMFHIQQSGRFPEPRARFYAAEIVSGLKFLHKRGIIYRDLKLDNILLDFDGHVRIADFGMCKLQIYLDKTADTFCGTPDYMAPEIIKGLKYNQAVDWWSFGVLLYEMLIGQSPFSGCDEDELFWSICNEMPSYPRFLSKEALSILTRLLDKDARTRLGGAECMHGDIRDQDFFHPVIWDRLERRELEAPFKPRVRHPLDTQYFDRAFTGERPRLTAVEPHVLRSMDQEPFRGFSYTNPNATDR